jgi:hypothetical protein
MSGSWQARSSNFEERELDKHAGRLRQDMEQRLHAARDRLERAMHVELEQTLRQLLEAVTVAEERLGHTEQARRTRLESDRDALLVAQRAAALADGADVTR